ncbi:MAG: laccase domain-containing protein [Zetaproteobacteria bacterium]|nr:laccase domain-containing protein [Zetaproteobacteria bacterium]
MQLPARTFSDPNVEYFHTVKDRGSPPPDCYFLEQVHQNRIHQVGKHSNIQSYGQQQGDGLTTQTANITIGVKSADCVPILCFEKSTRTVAALHSGWRSTVAGIFAHFVQHHTPQQIEVWLGPAICGNCFLVREDVFHLLRSRAQEGGFLDKFTQEAVTTYLPGQWGIDLRHFIFLEMTEVHQLSPSQIQQSTLCTYHDHTKLPSYRRDGHTRKLLWSCIRYQQRQL